MAAGRDPRKTAGNRLSRLLEDETEEEFYKTAWGGFDEEAGDGEFEVEASGSDDGDDVDSDFDNPENEVDEPVSDDADEVKKRRKKVVVFGQKKSKPKPQPTEKKQKIKVKTPDGKREDLRKSSRVAVVRNSRALKVRLAEEERRKQSRRPRRRQTMIKITQEEMLREAKITEMENLASLNVYIQLEEEKKKMRTLKKRVLTGPVVRFQSLTMPDITIPESTERRVCSRNFLTFTDESRYPHQYFSSNIPPSPPEKSYCVITGLPAKYRDPATSYPYANLQAFRILRQHHSRGTLAALVTNKDRLKALREATEREQHQVAPQVESSQI
jgi:vacuolar protein sorting-associated protein 72